MTKIEYIRQSHKTTNQKLRKWLGSVYLRAKERNIVLSWLWLSLSWVIFGVVTAVSWLTFAVTLIFINTKYSIHYMECEIAHQKMSQEQAREYIAEKSKEYDRNIAYGSVPEKEQKRVEKTFEYLFSQYPMPKEAPQPDITAELHREVIENISGVKDAIVTASVSVQKSVLKYDEVITGISEVKQNVSVIADFTEQKKAEEAQQGANEAQAIAEAKERQERHWNKKGFEHNPEDFSPKLTNKQIEILMENINDIGIFNRIVSAEEFRKILLCIHDKPLQTTHNKMLALLLETLCDEEYISPKWQRIAADKQCFRSKLGKPLKAKDLSSAKQNAELMNEKKYNLITDSVSELRKYK